MHYNRYQYPLVEVKEAYWESGSDGAVWHWLLEVDAPMASYEEQFLALHKALQMMRERYENAVPIMARYFLSDISNQAARVYDYRQECGESYAVSVIGQPPLNGSKLALWIMLQSEVVARPLPNGLLAVERPDHTHLWLGSAVAHSESSYSQTKDLLQEYDRQLFAQHCTLADHCVRTWFFVQNVDVNYAGVVEGRNWVFDQIGLTSQTHFIASTGIDGRNADPRISVQMDAYSVQGLMSEQIQYLYAPEWLNPTYEYGVSFERGTAVHYASRSEVYISGTASIDNYGEVLYVGDIAKQTQRMWQNVEALLAEAECSFEDVAQAVVYLRDVADYALVKALYEKRFPNLPYTIVLAPVCRPSWLIEMECIAIRENRNPNLPSY
nr:Rid family hydrolase [uncultured Porphyromonas sp.]